jgi:hypothetical protein
MPRAIKSAVELWRTAFPVTLAETPNFSRISRPIRALRQTSGPLRSEPIFETASRDGVVTPLFGQAGLAVGSTAERGDEGPL